MPLITEGTRPTPAEHRLPPTPAYKMINGKWELVGGHKYLSPSKVEKSYNKKSL